MDAEVWKPLLTIYVYLPGMMANDHKCKLPHFFEEMIYIRRKGKLAEMPFVQVRVWDFHSSRRQSEFESKLCLEVWCPEGKSSLHHILHVLEQNWSTIFHSFWATSLGWSYRSLNQKFLIWNLHIYFKRIINNLKISANLTFMSICSLYLGRKSLHFAALQRILYFDS